MIKEISYIQSESFNPYENLALEEQLLEDCHPDECILYLWQNKKTVVIGKNQNPWKECRVERLEADGGFIARRLSGGGAVYHDTGNLNFTFIVRKDNYNLDRQLQVILNATNSLGITATRSGRNDILADGKKFSGNAFYKKGDCYYHHGTLMVDVDTVELSKYLTVSDTKLKSKGVDSVKSRVTNLRALNPDISIESLKQALIHAFRSVYDVELKQRFPESLDHNSIDRKINILSSWEWLFGRNIQFQHQVSGRTEAGEVTLQLQVQSGIVTDLLVYSDAMDHTMADVITERIKGAKYTGNELQIALDALGEDIWQTNMK